MTMLATLLLLSVHFFDSGWVDSTRNTHDPLYMHANWTVCDLPPVPNECVAVVITATYERATSLVYNNPYPYPMVRGNLGVGITGAFAGAPGIMYPTLAGVGTWMSMWDHPMWVDPGATVYEPIPLLSSTVGPFTSCYGEDATVCGQLDYVATSLTPYEQDGTIWFAPLHVAYVDSLAWLTDDGRRWVTFQSESVPQLFTVQNSMRATGFVRYLNAAGNEL
jgi:hypothetical protein